MMYYGELIGLETKVVPTPNRLYIMTTTTTETVEAMLPSDAITVGVRTCFSMDPRQHYVETKISSLHSTPLSEHSIQQS